MKLPKYIWRSFNTISTTSKPQQLPNSITSIEKLHARLIVTQLQTDPYSLSPVIKAYALSSSHLHKAHLLFNQVHQPTLRLWNHMIRGFSLSDKPDVAIHMYNRLYHHGLTGDNFTFIFVLKACARVLDSFHTRKVHVHSIKLGFEPYLFVSNVLIRVYASLGDVVLARNVFDGMGQRDLVSWNSLICGYSQCNRFKEVLGLFNQMQEADVKADAVTMVKVVLACVYLGELEIADSVMEYIEENLVEVDVYLGNTLIDMHGRNGCIDLARGVFNSMKERNIVSWNSMIMGYAKIGDVVRAKSLFDEMHMRDLISWTTMINCYCQANQFSEAVNLFRKMMVAKVKPDEVTMATVLSACAHLGSHDVGHAIHNFIRTHGVKTDVYVENSLIDMYCKCGEVGRAMDVFNEMKEKDSVSWTSVISGLAVNGFAKSAFELFSQMLTKGVKPTHGTYVGVLLACAHAGLVDEGLKYFGSMEKIHGLKPEMKHYGCVVDLLSRSGYLERAYDFIQVMPVVPDVVVWRTLLSACKIYKNLGLAEIITRKLLELDPSNSGNYVLLSNTYASSERWNDATKLRELMVESDVQKPSGCSLIELNGLTSDFSVETSC